MKGLVDKATDRQVVIVRSYPRVNGAQSAIKTGHPSTSDDGKWFLPRSHTIVTGKEKSGEVRRVVDMKVCDDNDIDIVDFIACFKKTPYDGRSSIYENIGVVCNNET